MPSPSTRSWWLFPPTTGEVPLDEKWGFGSHTEKSCEPLDPPDRLRGDDWDHPAVDPESRLLLGLVPGQRDGAACQEVVQEVRDRAGARTDLLLTSDEHASSETALRAASGIEPPRPRRPGPGRPPKPVKVLPPDWCSATVRQRREKGRVVEVVRALVFGTLTLLQDAPGALDGEHDDHHVDRRAAPWDGSGSELPHASPDRWLLQGDGPGPRRVGFPRVQLPLLLVRADVAYPPRGWMLDGSDPGDGGGTNRPHLEP